jgi:hypothetical protein
MATKPKTPTAKQTLAQANALLAKAKTQLKTTQTSKAALDTFVTESKAAVTELGTVATEAKTSAEASAKMLGGKIVDNKFIPAPRTVSEVVSNGDGTSTIIYSNGSREIIGTKIDTSAPKPTTNIDVLKAGLKGLGFSAGVIDSSTGFLTNLLAEGLDYDNATDIFLNNKEFTLKSGTTIKSPFYTEYGYLNEVVASPKTPSELYNAVEGYKIVQQRFNLDKKFLTPDYLKDLVKNNVDVDTFSQRANIARLAAINADPAKVDALIKLGNIKDATGLTDFYLDPKIGQEVMQQNVNTAAFVTEAVRRAQSGIAVDTENAKKIGAQLTAKGFSEAQVSSVAAQGFEVIGQQLAPLTKLEQIYGQTTGMGALPEKQLRADLQKQLEAEQFQGTESELRKRRKEQEELAFQRKSGTIGANRLYGGSLGNSSTTGMI